MPEKNQSQGTNHPIPVRRAVVALAVGGMSTAVWAVGTAGAVTSPTKPVVVSTARYARFGTILVSGKTLYTLQASRTPCGSLCIRTWPELLLPKGVAKATAGRGVTASKLGTVMRANGARQVTYGGKPLYWFSGDRSAGQVNGNITDTWGKWSVYVTVKPSTSAPAGGTTPTTSASTGGAAF
jgi:predicted lipoprotein with Yx(FWY)xxD motif